MRAQPLPLCCATKRRRVVVHGTQRRSFPRRAGSLCTAAGLSVPHKIKLFLVFRAYGNSRNRWLKYLQRHGCGGRIRIPCRSCTSRQHRFRNHPKKEKKRLMKYEKLFQPGKNRDLELRNRVVRRPWARSWATGTAAPRRSRSVSMRIAPRAAAASSFRNSPPWTPTAATATPSSSASMTAGQIKSFQLICEAVHRHGAKIFIQLHHGCREAPPLQRRPSGHGSECGAQLRRWPRDHSAARDDH